MRKETLGREEGRIGLQHQWPCPQVRSLAELGWFLSAGTAAQLFALGVVAWRLASNPVAGAATRLVAPGGAAALAPALIAFMNIVFACAPAPAGQPAQAAVLPNSLAVL